MSLADEIAAAAAVRVVEEGLDYATAKRKAARDLLHRQPRSAELPSNEAVEDAVVEHIAIFHADTQPGELRALRELALAFMRRIAPLRPHLGGAAWRGTATRLSALHIDLYADDPKAAEILLLNEGVDFDVEATQGSGALDLPVLSVALPCPALRDTVTAHLFVRDLDDLRGALKPDARGRSWRGDARALERRLEQDAAAGPPTAQGQ